MKNASVIGNLNFKTDFINKTEVHRQQNNTGASEQYAHLKY